MDRRAALQKKQQIVLSPFFVPGADTVFHIEKEIDRGSSAICYEAYYQQGDVRVRGTLKEFYPYDFDPFPAFDLVRDESVDDEHKNQLYSKKGTLQNFLTFKEGYVYPYDVLRKERAKTDADAAQLNAYLPDCEVYRGRSPKGYDPENHTENHTVYIWVRNEPDFQTYGAVLRQICRRMEDESYNSVADLELVLNCLLELAKCVNTLHCRCLYHLDLKPANFGISMFRGRPNSNVRISLYDINSLYSSRCKNRAVLCAGTPYFRSPNVANRREHAFGPKSDVYSLGALLYYSLVVQEKTDGATGWTVYRNVRFCEGGKEFDEDAYNSIGAQLRNSPFLSYSDETDNSIILRKLDRILRRALNTSAYHNANGFCETAEEFARDLEEVIQCLKNAQGAAAINQTTEYHVQTSFEKKEDYLAAKNKNGAAGVIQWLLYQYPLYDYCIRREGREDGCNVLVVGGATYASKFIDLAFELSQVKNCWLDITVASKDAAEDKAAYLATRPGMRDFFEIDDQKAKQVPVVPYGRLSFLQADLPVDDPKELKKAVEEICKDRRFTYVFIALGEEDKNERVAEACSDCLTTGQDKAIVGYTVYDENKPKECMPDGRLTQPNVTALRLSVFDSLDRHEEYRALRQMAFNAHLTWSDSYINDIPKAKAEFRSKYNFNSSLENALSIRYKLHGLCDKDGNRLSQITDPRLLAAEVERIVSSPGNKSDVEELVCYEHRRWIVEKVTNAYQTLTDLSVLHTDTKDKAHMRHPCIVPSEGKFVLSEGAWKNHDKWDTADEKEKKVLDGLDRLSVDLHQHFSRKAKKLQHDRMDLDLQKETIRKAVAQDAFALCIYDSMSSCIESMIAGGKDAGGYIEKFRYYKKLLLGTKLPGEDEKKAAQAISRVESILFPVIQAASYKNWKTIDEQLIRNIPFILTYSSSLHLCIPFFAETRTDRSTTKLFGNVASALMLNPLYVTYIVDGDTALRDLESLKKSLAYCVNILSNHRLQTKINVMILRRDKDALSAETTEELFCLSDRIDLVDDIVYEDADEDAGRFLAMQKYLSQKSTSFSAIERNDTTISGLLESANVTAAPAGQMHCFPVYRFNSAERTFSFTTSDCAFLTYVRNKPNLLMEDLFYSRGRLVESSEPELINEHGFLWDIYTGSAGSTTKRRMCACAWKELCKSVSNHLLNAGRIATISCSAKDPSYKQAYDVYFPSYCSETVDQVMAEMKSAECRQKLFEDYSMVRVDSKSCKMTIRNARKDVLDEIEKMLIEPLRLAEKSMVKTTVKPSAGKPRVIEIHALDLRVDQMTLPKEPKYSERCLTILQELSNQGCIRSYAVSSDQMKVSFTFATENHMRLMENAKNILKLHIYRNAVESGAFDDVKSSATVYWDQSGTSDELDIVLIKGFKTFIGDCQVSDKLHQLGEHFGVNNKPIVFTDRPPQKSKQQTSASRNAALRTQPVILSADDPIGEMQRQKLI